jgi:hypothetical protein
VVCAWCPQQPLATLRSDRRGRWRPDNSISIRCTRTDSKHRAARPSPHRGYCQALLDSARGWHEGTADPWPWLSYFTGVIAGACAVFADRAAAAQSSGTKQQRVREHVLRHGPATFRLADIRTALPGVSDQAIRLVLEQLRGDGKVRADGTGRSATWTRIPNTAPFE